MAAPGEWFLEHMLARAERAFVPEAGARLLDEVIDEERQRDGEYFTD